MRKKRTKFITVTTVICVCLFTLYITIQLLDVQNQIKQARIQTELSQERNRHQQLVNAGIEARNELGSSSENREQYVIDAARDKLNLVFPNEILFIDISKNVN